MPRNPLDAYTQTRKAVLTGRDIEIAVLEKAAMKFRMLIKEWEEGQTFNRKLDEAVKFNQRIWDIFQSDWKNPDCKLPIELRQNLLSLSIYVRKSSLDILAAPTRAKLEILVNINENIAAGISEGRKPAEQST